MIVVKGVITDPPGNADKAPVKASPVDVSVPPNATKGASRTSVLKL